MIVLSLIERIQSSPVRIQLAAQRAVISVALAQFVENNEAARRAAI